MNLIRYIQAHVQWSTKTFGHGAHSTRLINHIRKELDEVAADPSDLEEWIDVIILALDGAWRAGYNAADIAKMLMAKLKKNQTRTFIISEDPDQPAEHDRGQEEGSTMKSSRVTIKDLEEEIRSLRVGLGNQTDAMRALQDENRHLIKTLGMSREDVSLLESELNTQQQSLAQAHETISLLVRKMPSSQARPGLEPQNGQDH